MRLSTKIYIGSKYFPSYLFPFFERRLHSLPRLNGEDGCVLSTRDTRILFHKIDYRVKIIEYYSRIPWYSATRVIYPRSFIEIPKVRGYQSRYLYESKNFRRSFLSFHFVPSLFSLNARYVVNNKKKKKIRKIAKLVNNIISFPRRSLVPRSKSYDNSGTVVHVYSYIYFRVDDYIPRYNIISNRDR